jgi:hypothetical protein
MATNREWLLTEGGWKPIEVDWSACPHTDDWTASLKQWGYEFWDQGFTIGDLWGVRIFRAIEDRRGELPAEFLVYLVTTGEHEPVLVADFPRLLGILPEFQRYALERGLLDWFIELRDTVNRAFHAWHGHAPHDACMKCDPLEVCTRQAERCRDGMPA